MKWQPIETAPNSRLILAWIEGSEFHSDVEWRRSGYALIALHDGVPVKRLIESAAERIIGPTDNDWFLTPTHWMPLPEQPGVVE